MPKLKNRSHLTNVFGDLIDLAKFESKKTAMPNGCIEYDGIKHRQGYQFVGRICGKSDRYQFITAHRLAMKLKLGRDLDRKEQVIHTCSNVKCVNPDHLVLGNTRDRCQVMKDNGRSPVPQRGKYIRNHKQQNRKYKYTIEEMLFIRDGTNKEIAKRFNVTASKAASMKGAYTSGYQWLENFRGK